MNLIYSQVALDIMYFALLLAFAFSSASHLPDLPLMLMLILILMPTMLCNASLNQNNEILDPIAVTPAGGQERCSAAAVPHSLAHGGVALIAINS